MKSIFILFISLLFSSISFGDDFLIDDSRVANQQSQESSGLGLATGTVDSKQPKADETYGSTVDDSGGFTETNQGSLDGTNNLQGKGSSVNIMGLAMAGMYMSQCGPHNAWACAAAAMSVADAMAGGEAKNSAYNTGSYLDTYGEGSGSGADPLINQQLQDIAKDLETSGYKVNSDGSVTTPDGSVITSSDLSSEEAIKNAFNGMSDADAKNAFNQIEQGKADAAKKAGLDLNDGRNLASEEDGGQAVGGSGASASQGDSNENGGAVGALLPGDQIIEEVEYRGRKKKDKNKLSAKKVAALSKDFNGDPIGIGLANLFLIVHEKYNEKRNKKNEFINREY